MLVSAMEDTMRKLGIKKLLLVLSALGAVLAGCSNSLEERYDGGSDSSNLGSISINDSRAVFAGDIVSALVTVSGTGIKSGSEPTGPSSVADGKGTLSVSGIPAGKNRIVTVQAFNNDGKINGIVIRAICDVESGKNSSVSVNWGTTALGNVLQNCIRMEKIFPQYLLAIFQKSMRRFRLM